MRLLVAQLAQLSGVYLVHSLANKAKELAEMDSTAIGIASGLVFSIIYALMLLYYKKAFDLQHTILIFLAAFSVPGGVGLIHAGLSGASANLPSNWREHVVVAGIVVIGLAAQYVVTRILGCIRRADNTTVIPAKQDAGGA